MVFYRIVGALSTSIPKGSVYAGLERFTSPHKAETFGQDYEWSILLQRLRQSKLIFLGEVHSVPAICQFQYRIIQALTPSLSNEYDKQQRQEEEEEEDSKASSSLRPKRLHIVMEHFSLDMQELLNAFCQGQINFAQLKEQYHRNGAEGHALEPYQPLLEHVQQHTATVQLHAGFVPKRIARTLMKQGETVALQQAAAWLPATTMTSSSLLQGLTPFHYNYFESLLTGRNLHLSSSYNNNVPSKRFAGIFQAQLLKDVGMAHKINQLIDDSVDDDDQIVVIAGNGHVEYHQGVPERVLTAHPELVERTCLITCHSAPQSLLEQSTAPQLLEILHLGSQGANPADFVFVFPEDDWITPTARSSEAKDESVHGQSHSQVEPLHSTPSLSLSDHSKVETRGAYNQVGETAHLQGNLARAHAIMKYLGYTTEEIDVAGSDAYNFQGVGNPHLHAKIQPGETVLDIGSGLGVDSFIAAHRAGPKGRLIGIDIAAKEVAHAQRRADERRLDIRFATADMEQLPLPDDSFDVVISNGAFCLAPNKHAAFSEIFRVLKPGGRMVVCTSTIQKEESLGENVEWPICMRMFIEKKRIQPMCEEIGFTNVIVDDSDRKMVFELQLPAEAAPLNPERYRVHGDSPEFAHLEKYDMDQLCARVCVVARKPLEKEQ